MFLTRMVTGFISSKDSNKNLHNNNNNCNSVSFQQQQQQQQQQQPQINHVIQQQQQHASQQLPAKSPKSNKKTEKYKRPLSKTDSKKSITDLIKSPAKEPPPGRDATSNINTTSYAATSTTSASGMKTPPLKPTTKVKSGSWKRSEKQISGYNGISGKKSKSLRKRSPTWLKFPNSSIKIAEKVTVADSTSVCRPGTLYSDVLFGAGSSCMVNIKTLTPRRNINSAQKKLTKALVKCAGNENEASGSDTESDRELFPSLNEYGKPTTPATMALTAKDEQISITPLIAGFVRSDDEADVVILSETNGVQTTEKNSFNDISYGNYLEEHFKHMNGNAQGPNGNRQHTNGPMASISSSSPKSDSELGSDLATATTTITMALDVGAGIGLGVSGPAVTAQLGNKCPSGKPFFIDIPQWNFLDADISSDAAYPKFLCQFEDEHYLKAEKMALLGLKLALGNDSQQAKFKF